MAVIAPIIGRTTTSDNVFFWSVPIALISGIFVFRDSFYAVIAKIVAVWFLIIAFAAWAVWQESVYPTTEWIPATYYILPLAVIGVLFHLFAWVAHRRAIKK